MPAKPTGDLGSRWNRVLSSAIIGALLVAEQGSSLSALAADVVNTGGAPIRINVVGAVNGAAPYGNGRGTAETSSLFRGVDFSIPTGIQTAGGVENFQVRPNVVESIPALPQAQALTAQPSAIVPVLAADPEAIVPTAQTPAQEAATESSRQAVADKTQAFGVQIEKAQRSGGVGAFFAKFFDGKKGSAKTDAVAPGSTKDAVVKPAQQLSAATSDAKAPAEAKVPAPAAHRKFIEFNVQYLKDIKKLFAESKTKPNKQDFVYLATKTFGLNLIIRVAFAVKGVQAGQLPLMRAILSTSWYQIQDAVFTVFGQTYMKFLGRMTGMLRIGKAELGDVLFTYVQLVGQEFINRLVLGPIGENPLVYTPAGIGLLFLNNLQGMVSGGLINPVINKLFRAGLIGEKTKSHLYQLASLTMHLGLLATFGYQHLFTIITTALMVLSWAAYIGLSFFAKDKVAEKKL